MMTEVISNVLIPVLTVLASVFVSLLTSRKMISTESRKLRFQAKSTYDTKVLDKRLEVYPFLYSILSSFNKEYRDHEITQDMIQSFLNKVNDWDSKHALYLSAKTADECFRFRSHLRYLSKMKKEDFKTQLSVGEELLDDANIKDAYSLIAKLRSDSNQSTKPISQFIWKKFDRATQKKLLAESDNETLSKQKDILVNTFNIILQEASFYNPVRFKGINLRSETKFMTKGYVTGNRLIRLNRRLLEDTYSGEIQKNLSAALHDKAVSLEFSLKSDIGIYGIENSGVTDYETKFVKSFNDIEKSFYS